MRKKHYWIFYKIDIKKLLFIVMICDKTKKSIYNITFSRNNMLEECMDNNFLYYLSNTDKYKIIIHEQKLSSYAVNEINRIFPYIPQFTNLEDFYFWYNRMNTKFDYYQYMNVKVLLYKILLASEYSADGKWNCIQLENKNYLYCKWKDSRDSSHIVILNNDFFISDLQYRQIYQQEMQMGFSLDFLKIQSFMEENPTSMLDIYLNKGGKKIFSFLTARIMNHPMELLSKAGLIKLADNIDKYQNINMRAKTLPDIFGVPLLVLKSVNSGEDSMLYTQEDRILLLKAFHENSAVFLAPMSVMVELWIRYYYLNHQTVYGIKNIGSFMATLQYLNKLAGNEHEAYTIFGLYQNYLAYSQRIGNYVQGLYPKNLLSAVEEAISILQIRYEEEKVLQFKTVVTSLKYQLLEEDLSYCKYRICIPKTQEELCIAGKELHNCLKNYVSRVRNNKTMIAFIQDKQKENKLIGAIEIHSGKIVQALGPCNQKLSKEVCEYLQDYMERKNLLYK